MPARAAIGSKVVVIDSLICMSLNVQYLSCVHCPKFSDWIDMYSGLVLYTAGNL